MNYTDDAFTYMITSGGRNSGKSWIQKMFESGIVNPKIGIDWAWDSGMNRGDINKRDGNVIHVQFKTVTFE